MVHYETDRPIGAYVNEFLTDTGKEIMRIRCGVPLCLLAMILLSAPASAQDQRVLHLMDVAWTSGAGAALREYDALPPGERRARLLVSVADQLLWTGKRPEAVVLLTRAIREAPDFTEARFQLGRAALQHGDTRTALDAFRAGLAIVDRDSALDGDARNSLRRRLDNRIGFLEHAGELLRRTGAYRTADGRILLLKFDPYINTFPALVEPATGSVRILYPAGGTALEWRTDDGDRAGTVSFEDGPSSLLVQGPEGASRATTIGVTGEPVRFAVGGATIAATLFRPAGSDPVPAMVLTPGAGLATRYNLESEALAFAAGGIAALVYDKPGLGGSTGGNWLLLSISDQARYVEAAVKLLRQRPDIGPTGVWGFSQGGWVAPIVAASDTSVAIVELVSGAAVGPQEQYLQSVGLRLRRDSLPAAQVDAALTHLRSVWARVNAGAQIAELAPLYAAAGGTPWGDKVPRLTFQWEVDWWRENEVNAAEGLRGLRVPVLAMLGEADEAVPPPDNVPLLARYLTEAPTGDYTITVLPDASHQMMVGDDYHPRYFATMVDWARARLLPVAH